VVLGRPTARAVTASILSAEGLEGYFEYGSASGKYTQKTGLVNFSPGIPVEVQLDRLSPDKQFFYRICRRKPGESAFTRGEERSFHMQRAPGSTFVFEIQGDSHPERPHQFNPELYAQTLRSAAADRPDFYMTIGDDFSVDKLRTVNAETVSSRYRLNVRFWRWSGNHRRCFW